MLSKKQMTFLSRTATVAAVVCASLLTTSVDAVGPNEALCGPTDADSCVNVKGPFSMEMYPKADADNVYSEIKLKMVEAVLWTKNTTAPAFVLDSSEEFAYHEFKGTAIPI